MKINYSKRTTSGIGMILAGLFLLGTLFTKAQCAANYTYTLGASGSVSVTSTSSGTSSSSSYSWTSSAGSASGPIAAFNFTANGYKIICLSMNSGTTTPICTSSICDTVWITNAPTSTTCNLTAGASNYLSPGPGGFGFTGFATGTVATTTYSYDYGDGGTSIGKNGVHNYAANGNYTVTFTANNNVTPACVATNTLAVTVTNYCGLTPSYSYTLGANGSVSFSSTSVGTTSATTYYWSFGSGPISYGPTATRTFTNNGVKWVCLNAQTPVPPPGNCTVIYCDSIHITNVTGSVTPCNANVMYTLTKDTTMALTWNAYPSYPLNVSNATWYWGDGSSSTGLYPSHTYSAAGTYSTCVTVSVSCDTITGTYCYVASIFRNSQSTAMVTVNVKQSSMETGIKAQQLQSNLVNIYPNPNNGLFTISFNESDKDSKETNVYIYNILGEKVFEKVILSSTDKTINVSELPNGTYFVKLVSSTGYANKKISIQK